MLVRGNSHRYYFMTKDTPEKINIVLLHGLADDKHIANRLFSYFHKKPEFYNVISIDLPGHGQEKLGDVTTLTDLAIFVNKQISNYIQNNYVILGFSAGGMVALRYASLYKNDKNLLVIGIWSSPLITPFKDALPLFTRLICSNCPLVAYYLAYHLDKLLKLLGLPSQSAISKIAPRDYVNVMGILFKEDQHDFANDIPKVFIYGKYDFTVSNRNYHYVKSLKLPNSHAYLLPFGGHLLTGRCKNEVCSIFDRHIQDLNMVPEEGFEPSSP